jgi:uncharacterized protein (DUF2252 family)
VARREGRLGWGVNDFDEGYPPAYTADLVRLATNVKLAIDAEALSLSLKDGCQAVLDGYRACLRAGGCPLVLAEAHENIRHFGFDALNPRSGSGDVSRACLGSATSRTI